MIGALIERMRVAHREERGMTLVELMVSVALMMIVATIFTTVLLAMQRAVIRQQARSEMNDQARLAMEQMDREIRSGNVLYAPEEEALSAACGGKTCERGYTLRVYTQSNAPTRVPPIQCVQWVVDGQGLWRRAWASGAATSLDGWRLVAEHVVNQDVPTPVAAFSMDPTPGDKVLNITMLLNSRLGASDAPRTVRMNTSIAIRNTGTGDPCSPIPST